ncbi:SRPBCC family protein [Actinomadura sp. NPDC000600]|uniref:type II toxin-antitoxin system Rv0910 family toxin n=1 Tax=Actinomadura sp. NPDC000600 TaxID=3154262 RepID=UPI0033940631
MPKATISADLAPAPERIWEVLAELPRMPEWFAMHEKFVTEPPAAASAGAAFKQGVKIMGMPGDVEWTVETADAPNRLEMSGKGPMGITLRTAFTVEASGTGSTVTCDMEFSGGMLAGPLGMSVQKEAAKNTEESLAKLGALAA